MTVKDGRLPGSGVAPSSIIIVWFYQNLVNIYTSNSQFFHGFPLRKNKSTRNNKKKQTSRNFSVSLTSSYSNNSYQTKRLPVLSCGHRAKSAEWMGRNRAGGLAPSPKVLRCSTKLIFSRILPRKIPLCLFEKTCDDMMIWSDHVLWKYSMASLGLAGSQSRNTQGLCTVFATWLRLKNFKRSVSCIFILRLQFKFIF